MSIRYIRKDRSNLPVDIMVFRYKGRVDIAFKEATNKKVPLIPLDGIRMNKDNTTLLNISSQELGVVRSWINLNSYLIGYLMYGELTYKDFVSLMFKGGENPSKEKIDIQHKLVELLVFKGAK